MNKSLVARFLWLRVYNGHNSQVVING